MPRSEPGVMFGVDHLMLEDARGLGDRRVALLTHDAAVTALRPRPVSPSRVALLRAGVRLTVLFAPEHGLDLSAADGAAVSDGRDPLTGLPVRSLYGAGFRPAPEMLDDVDLLLVDLQDIGARFYTYIWTLSHALEACALAQVPVWVLDRPNPLGGDLAAAEGPVFDESLDAGLAGRWAMPVRHSLTIGELARAWNRMRGLGAALRVIAAPGWRRARRWPHLGLPFVPTSPAIPSYETAVLYPGTGLLEGLNVNEGRGTAWPFRVVGAPWMDGDALASALNARGLPGLAARPVAYVPWAGRHARHPCRGVMLHVIDEDVFRPVACGLHLVDLIWRLHPHDCAWARYETAVNPPGRDHFDRLIGRRDIGVALAGGREHVDDLVRAWTAPGDWALQTRPDLLYE